MGVMSMLTSMQMELSKLILWWLLNKKSGSIHEKFMEIKHHLYLQVIMDFWFPFILMVCTTCWHLSGHIQQTWWCRWWVANHMSPLMYISLRSVSHWGNTLLVFDTYNKCWSAKHLWWAEYLDEGKLIWFQCSSVMGWYFWGCKTFCWLWQIEEIKARLVTSE